MPNIFSTSDFGLATTLKSLQFNLLDLEKTNPKKIRFIFQGNKNIEDAVKRYRLDQLLVNPRVYYDCQRLLKNMIYSN